MKYLKDASSGRVYAFQADGSQDEYIPDGLTPMSAEEVEAHKNPPREAVVPEQVARAQGKAALIQAGLWGAVTAYVEGIEDETARALAEVAVRDTTHWQRSSPFLNAAAAALDISDDQLDALFVQAAEIQL